MTGREGVDSGAVTVVGPMIGDCCFVETLARRPGRPDIAFSSRIKSETLPLRLFPSRPMNPVPQQREQLGFTPRQVQSDIPTT